MKKELKNGWLFIVPWIIEDIGGVNRVVLELCQECSKAGGYTPYLATPKMHPRVKSLGEKKVFKHIAFRTRLLSLTDQNKFKNLLFYLLYLPFELLKIQKLIRTHGIKVVNFHYVGGLSPLSFVIFQMFTRHSFKLIFSFHGSDVLTLEKSTPGVKKIFNFILSKTDHAVCCSKGLSEQIRNLFPNHSDKVGFIHNGISELFLSRDSIDVEIDELPAELQGQRFVLSVGAFLRIKGHDLLIKAFARVKKIDSKILLVIIGKSATELEYCRKLAESLGIAQSLYIYERVPPERLAGFYEHAQMVVSSSRYESFGLVLAEAGASGVPLVATRTLGAQEIITNEVSGLLVDREDPNALAEAMIFLLRNPEIGRMYSEKLRQIVLSGFRWNYAWEKYEKLADNPPSDMG